MFAVDADAVTEITTRIPTEDGMFWTWTYTFPDGAIQKECDLIRLKARQIRLKDAYRKVLPETGIRSSISSKRRMQHNSLL